MRTLMYNVAMPYLDWDREEVNFLYALDLPVLNQPSQFGYGAPFLVFILGSTSPSSPSTSAASSSAPSAPEPSTKSASFTGRTRSVRHLLQRTRPFGTKQTSFVSLATFAQQITCYEPMITLSRNIKILCNAIQL